MKFFAALLAAPLAAAHFQIEYPYWRGDSFTAPASQYTYPCAGINATTSNRTLWPTNGGSVKLDLHHPWTTVWINLGLGATASVFNISLTPNFYNVTGNGTWCVPKLNLPRGVTIADGTQGSLQVVTGGASGSVLYNCADVIFTNNATTLSNNDCQTTPGLRTYTVPDASASNTTLVSSNGTRTNTTTAPSGSATGGASQASLSSLMMGIAMVAGLTLF